MPDRYTNEPELKPGERRDNVTGEVVYSSKWLDADNAGERIGDLVAAGITSDDDLATIAGRLVEVSANDATIDLAADSFGHARGALRDEVARVRGLR